MSGIDYRYINGVCVPLNSGSSSYSSENSNSRSRSSSLNANALSSNFKSDYKSLHSSFVNPNAVCQECGATVFYYESENGGQVYFDELGVPWSKHSCMDNSIRKNSNILNAKMSSFRWQQKKWQPFLFLNAHNADCYYTEIEGGFEGDNLLLYIRDFKIPLYLLAMLPIQIRNIDKQLYEFSTFSLLATADDYEVIELKYDAFDSLRIARQNYCKRKN